MKAHRHAALIESRNLRLLPPHLWHHAHQHRTDLIRLWYAHGRIVPTAPFDTAAIIARDVRAERDRRQNAGRKAARKVAA